MHSTKKRALRLFPRPKVELDLGEVGLLPGQPGFQIGFDGRHNVAHVNVAPHNGSGRF